MGQDKQFRGLESGPASPKRLVVGIDAGPKRGGVSLILPSSDDLDKVLGRKPKARTPGTWSIFSRAWKMGSEVPRIAKVVVELLRRFQSLGYRIDVFAEKPFAFRNSKTPPSAGINQALSVGYWRGQVESLGLDLEEVPVAEWRAAFGVPNNDSTAASRRSKEIGRLIRPGYKWAAGDHETDAVLLGLSRDPDAYAWILRMLQRLSRDSDPKVAELARTILVAAFSATLPGKGKKSGRRGNHWTEEDFDKLTRKRDR